MFNGAGNDGEGSWFREHEFELTVRPMSSLTVSSGLRINRSVSDHQWVELVTDADTTNHYVFANINQTTFAVTGRVNYTMTPNLSLQLYGQPFVSGGDYRQFKELANGRDALYANRYSPYGYDGNNPDFNYKSFRTTNVLRWEYKPGSTLFVVWQQTRDESQEYGDVRFSRDFGRIFNTPAHNVLLVKLAYWINYYRRCGISIASAFRRTAGVRPIPDIRRRRVRRWRSLLQPGPQQRRRCVSDDCHNEPAQHVERERLDQPGGDDHAGNPTEREPQRRAPMEAARADEPDAGGRRGERARSHHDRKRGERVHPEQAEQHQARGVIADAKIQQHPEQKIEREREGEGARRQRERGAARRQPAGQADQHERGGDRQRGSHSQLHRAPLERRDNAGADPGARHAHRNQHRQLPGIHADDADEEQRLRHDRQRMADHHRSRNQLVRHETEESKHGRRRRKRPDTERVEEIGAEPDEQLGNRRRCRAGRGSGACRRPPADGEQQAACHQRTQQDGDERHGGRYSTGHG